MTPRASDIYFQLLDAKMEKLGSAAGAAAGAAPKGWRWFFGEPAFNWNKLRDFGNTKFRNAIGNPAAAPVVPEVIEEAVKNDGYGLGTILGAAGLTGIGAGALGHAYATQQAEEQAKKDKLLAFGGGFGGGLATGMAAPSIMGGINRMVGKLNRYVGNQGFTPMDTYGGYYPEQY